MSYFDATPDFTEHVFRSVRGWVHRLFPEPNIFVSRKQAAEADARPGFRIELVGGPEIEVEGTTSGMRWMNASVQVHYQGTDVYDAQRTLGTLVANAESPGRIPLHLYDMAYPRPPSVDVADPAGGTWPGEVDIAVAGESDEFGLFDPSMRVTIAPTAQTIRVHCVHFPAGQRLDRFYVYAAESGGPLRLQATVDGDAEAPSVELTGLAAGDSPPSQAVYRLGGLRVSGMTTSIEEMGETEIHHDANLVLRMYAQVPLTTRAQMVQELQP